MADLLVLLQRIWYSRRPGCTAEGRIRTLDLSAAVLNPSPALRRQRAFELTTPHERVLFVAANSAEWVHWLGVLTPLLDPKLAACFDSIPIGPADRQGSSEKESGPQDPGYQQGDRPGQRNEDQ